MSSDDEGEADTGRGNGERREEEEEEVRAELERRREWTNRVRAFRPSAAEAAERECDRNDDVRVWTEENECDSSM